MTAGHTPETGTPEAGGLLMSMQKRKYTTFRGYRESGGSATVTEDGVRAFPVGKAGEDSEARRALLADPRGIVEAEIGTPLPSELKIAVHEDFPVRTDFMKPIINETDGTRAEAVPLDESPLSPPLGGRMHSPHLDFNALAILRYAPGRRARANGEHHDSQWPLHARGGAPDPARCRRTQAEFPESDDHHPIALRPGQRRGAGVAAARARGTESCQEKLVGTRKDLPW